MPREQSDEAAWWFHAVYSAIQQIPHGKVTSYKHIADLLGYPKRARQVGVCLKQLPEFDPNNPEKHYFHGNNVPWQRVINSKGGISPRGDGGLAANRQVVKLRQEGVQVTDARGAEEAHVDFGQFGWFPSRLPDDPSDDDSEVDVKSEASG
jgi:methylated-DNA-protein-cysteine methyltransferase related protein